MSKKEIEELHIARATKRALRTATSRNGDGRWSFIRAEFEAAGLTAALLKAARVLEHGRHKFGARDWRGRSPLHHRSHEHAHAKAMGEGRKDSESGIEHEYHAAIRALMAASRTP